MSKKLLAVIISVTAVVVLIVVLGVTFTIRHVTIDTTSTLNLSEEEELSLIADSGIVMKSSILSVDENTVISNIENQHPSIKVISVERKFPNTVCVNLTDRTPVYAIRMQDGKYALIDRESKIVDIVESYDDYNYITPIIGYDLPSVQKGGFLNIAFISEITAEAENLSFVNQRFSSFIPSIEYLKVDNDVNKLLLRTNTGVVLVIKEVSGSMGTFFNLAYKFYMENLNTENQKSSGYVCLSNENVWTWSTTII